MIFFQMYKVNSKEDPKWRTETNSSMIWTADQEENRINIYIWVLTPKWNQQQSLETLNMVQFHWLLQKSHKSLIKNRYNKYPSLSGVWCYVHLPS